MTMAPEVHARRTGLASDWFSVGVVGFRCLAGVYPFAGTRAAEVTRAVLNGAVRWEALPGTVSVPMRDLLQGLLASDPATRIGSRDDALDLLEHPALALHKLAAADESVTGPSVESTEAGTRSGSVAIGSMSARAPADGAALPASAALPSAMLSSRSGGPDGPAVVSMLRTDAELIVPHAGGAPASGDASLAADVSLALSSVADE
jgi:serine/threonine protein kinase